VISRFGMRSLTLFIIAESFIFIFQSFIRKQKLGILSFNNKAYQVLCQREGLTLCIKLVLFPLLRWKILLRIQKEDWMTWQEES
jgi:hypothetical protein